MLPRQPLSGDAKAVGHRLYQELYAQVSENVPITAEQALEWIARLTSPDVLIRELIRATMAQANFRYHEASDDVSAQTVDNYIPEPTGRLFANSDIVLLLQEAQTQLWEAETASWSDYS